MVWGVIRVAIFTGSFLIGLMFFDSDGSPAAAKFEGVQSHTESVETPCVDRNMVLVRGGRAERQADLMGAQILYDANYDPRAMVQFFEKLEAKGGSRSAQFFSSHPNPGNRSEYLFERSHQHSQEQGRRYVHSEHRRSDHCEWRNRCRARSYGTRPRRRRSVDIV